MRVYVCHSKEKKKLNKPALFWKTYRSAHLSQKFHYLQELFRFLPIYSTSFFAMHFYSFDRCLADLQAVTYHLQYERHSIRDFWRENSIGHVPAS